LPLVLVSCYYLKSVQGILLPRCSEVLFSFRSILLARVLIDTCLLLSRILTESVIVVVVWHTLLLLSRRRLAHLVYSRLLFRSKVAGCLLYRGAFPSVLVLSIDTCLVYRYLSCRLILVLSIDTCLVDRYLSCLSILVLSIDTCLVDRYLSCRLILLSCRLIHINNIIKLNCSPTT